MLNVPFSCIYLPQSFNLHCTFLGRCPFHSGQFMQRCCVESSKEGQRSHNCYLPLAKHLSSLQHHISLPSTIFTSSTLPKITGKSCTTQSLDTSVCTFFCPMVVRTKRSGPTAQVYNFHPRVILMHIDFIRYCTL